MTLVTKVGVVAIKAPRNKTKTILRHFTITASHNPTSNHSSNFRKSSTFRTLQLQENADTQHLTVNEKIQKRVIERNSWPSFRIIGIPEALRFFCRTLPKILTTKIPSKQKLDTVFPVVPVQFDKIRNPPGDEIQVTWIGHASLLVQMGGLNILTDPMFSNRCSPFQFMGIERYRPPACTVQDLVQERIPIDVVLVSHNHYDHLDYNSIRELTHLYSSSFTEGVGNGISFLVPLGLRKWFVKNIPQTVEVEKCGHSVVELDWHESCNIKRNNNHGEGTMSSSEIEVTSVPMQHWSNRTGDTDKSLWCGFSICTKKIPLSSTESCDNGASLNKSKGNISSELKFLFTADTAWFEGLYDIGRLYGPYDMAAIPIGAYEPRDFMKCQHIDPQEAVLLMDAVRAKKAIPIHWGTFPLTFEPVMEPRELLVEAMEEMNKDKESFSPLLIGDTITS